MSSLRAPFSGCDGPETMPRLVRATSEVSVYAQPAVKSPGFIEEIKEEADLPEDRR